MSEDFGLVSRDGMEVAGGGKSQEYREMLKNGADRRVRRMTTHKTRV